MSLLFNVLFAWKCKNTHHKLALDALTQLRGAKAEAWTNLFLANIEPYLEGSKAPDERFKDFRNHVLHVSENHWGGAVQAARQWQAMTVESLRNKDWSTAVYRSGVLSHYYTDPIQPLHTAQSDAEGNIHRAAEWSIAQSYDQLRSLLLTELGGWPEIVVPAGNDWLSKMILAGADAAFPHYQTILDHYDISRGVKNPPAGLDRELRVCIARLIGHAVSGFARILERCFDEANASPPSVSISLSGVLSALSIPVYWVTKRMANATERAEVEATYRELQQTGLVKETLSDDDRTIRQLHAKEVLKTTEAALDGNVPAPTGTKHVTKEAVKTVAKPVEKPAPAKPVEKPAPVPAVEKPASAVTKPIAKPEPKPDPKPVAVAQRAEQTPVSSPKAEVKPAAKAEPKIDPKIEPLPTRLVDPVPTKTSPPIVKPERTEDPFSSTPLTSSQPVAVDRGAIKKIEADKKDAEVEPKADAFESPRPNPISLAPSKPEPPPVKMPALTANEVESPSKTPKPAGVAGSKSTAVSPKFYLEIDAPVVDAPSIGPKTADRLRSAGVVTVADLLAADSAAIAPRMNQKQVDADTVEEWKRQSSLMLRIPGLRGHDAQILVACGIIEPEDLLSMNPEGLLDLVDTFCCSPEGERVLRESPVPNLEEIQDWIIAAAQARPLPTSSTKRAA